MNAHGTSPASANGAQSRLGAAVSAVFREQSVRSLPARERPRALVQTDAAEARVASARGSQLPEFSMAWAAGFADGEACLHIAKQTYRSGRSDTYRLRVCISQNNLEVLEHFMKGLNIQARIHRVTRRAVHNRQCYTLNYDGAHAMALITALHPHFVRKRPEADAAVAFWTQGRIGESAGPKKLPPEVVATRERFYRKMKSLK
jgi:hypothetical protein